MGKEYCDILGNILDSSKGYYTARTASGQRWIPAFIESVDSEKCTGCGMCVKVCPVEGGAMVCKPKAI